MRAAKYLGVWMDTTGTYRRHATEVAAKAQKKMDRLNWILPNTGGPAQKARRLIVTAVTAVTHIWRGSLGAPDAGQPLEAHRRSGKKGGSAGHMRVPHSKHVRHCGTRRHTTMPPEVAEGGTPRKVAAGV